MRPTCCRHCVTGCEGVSGVWMHAAQEQPAGETAPVAYSVWKDNGCPMCAESARIAIAIDAEAQRTAEAKSDSAWLYGRVDGLDWALAIVRGES